MLLNRSKHCIGGDENALCECDFPIRRARFNPAANRVNCGRGKWRCQDRHPGTIRRIAKEPLIQFRVIGLACDDMP